jgi:hypothetical protein
MGVMLDLNVEASEVESIENVILLNLTEVFVSFIR